MNTRFTVKVSKNWWIAFLDEHCGPLSAVITHYIEKKCLQAYYYSSMFYYIKEKICLANIHLGKKTKHAAIVPIIKLFRVSVCVCVVLFLLLNAANCLYLISVFQSTLSLIFWHLFLIYFYLIKYIFWLPMDIYYCRSLLLIIFLISKTSTAEGGIL